MIAGFIAWTSGVINKKLEPINSVFIATGEPIFDFTVSGPPGSTYQGRRHAAIALNGEAAKRPSN